ncbi:hypothetical protein T01_15999 [Trichinella spiralis]|uniref:Uncharacterized protein n=1 Tax=Trichinella spiralis TaxID=6334 RepID=A0A0V0Z3B1_TRISP|nr:hypothetical protein T01_15999 [Trichinella spiralis]
MRYPLQSEFEAASSAFVLGSFLFVGYCSDEGYSSTKGKSKIDKLSTAAVFS